MTPSTNTLSFGNTPGMERGRLLAIDYGSIFEHIISQYLNSIRIFTDGSKTGRGIGSVFSHKGTSFF